MQTSLSWIFFSSPPRYPLALFGSLGRHLVSLWLSFGGPLAFLRLPGAPGCSLGAPSDVVYNLVSTFRANLTFHTRLRTRSSLQELENLTKNLPGMPGTPENLPGLPGKVVSRTAPPGPISTRAGGQDDVS